jgi:hypothetical protein
MRMRPLQYYLDRDETITPVQVSQVADILERAIIKLRRKATYEEDEDRKVRMLGVISELEKVVARIKEGGISGLPKVRFEFLNALVFTDVRDMLYGVSPSMDSKLALDAVLRLDALKFKKPPKRIDIMESKNKGKTVTENAAGGAGGGGAVGASSVAAYPTSLFKRPKMLRRRKGVAGIPVIKYHQESSDVFNLKESLMHNLLTEFTKDTFSPTDVQSKLTSAEKRLDFQKNTVPFGLKNENGEIIVVYVRPDQADDFENVVAAELNRTDQTPSEVAELLFNLRGRFDIVHAEFPSIPEDAEEPAPAGAAAGGVPPAPGETPPGGEEGLPSLGAEGGEALPPMGDMGGSAGGSNDAASALDKVIDMLKADIDARKAEADARKAQANADEAKYAAQIANDKIRSEQETLDAKGYYDEQKRVQDEAKKLGMLARYRSDTARDAEDTRAQGTF